jgi:PAS domain S-box-containing protein
MEACREGLQNLFDVANDPVQITSGEGELRYINPAWSRRLGYSAAEATQLKFGDLVQRESRDRCLEILHLPQPAPRRLDTLLVAKDGTLLTAKGQISYISESSEVWVLWHQLHPAIEPLPGQIADEAHGCKADTCLQMSDQLRHSYEQLQIEVSKRQSIEAALRDSEERFHQLADNIHQVFWMTAIQEDRIIYLSPAYERIWGRPCASIYASPNAWLDAIHPEDQHLMSFSISSALTGNANDIEYRIIRPDGEIRWIRDHAFPLRNEQGQVYRMVGIAEDITDRKHSETVSQQSEERLRLLESAVNNANDAIVITAAGSIDEPEPRIVYINKAHQRLTGYSPKEVIGKTPRLFQGPKSDRAQLDKIRLALSRWEPIRVEVVNYRKDGSEFWVELNIVPIANEAGWYTHWMSIQRDVTDRKQAEAEILQALVRERELGELRSRFISMTSHEFRTPLTTIQSSADLLEHFHCSPNEQQELFRQIQSAIKHMVWLMEDVLFIGCAESNKLEFHPRRMNLGELCGQVVAELETSTGRPITFELATQTRNTNRYLDEKLLRQILSNLLSNAIKYSSPPQPIRLILTCDAERVVLRVIDQGIGIPAEDKNHLFEYFHRATNVGTISGTGLGLAIVKKCVDLHQGTIDIESELNKGTTFTVTLPLK